MSLILSSDPSSKKTKKQKKPISFKDELTSLPSKPAWKSGERTQLRQAVGTPLPLTAAEEGSSLHYLLVLLHFKCFYQSKCFITAYKHLGNKVLYPIPQDTNYWN